MENNKLIAEFMGVKPKNNWFDGYELSKAGLPFSYGAMGNGTDELKFNTSWDWLMPVVAECLRIIGEGNEEWDAQYENINDTFYQVQINQTYKAVLDFINWYNDQK